MAAEGLDPRAILAALGVADAGEIAPLTGGWDAALWRVATPAGPRVLRVFRPEQAATCRREVAAMRAAGAGGLDVPEVYAVGAWRDRPALLLSWCPGRTLQDELARRPWRAWPLGRDFGRMQARLHAIAAPDGLGREPDGWIAWAGPDEAALQAHLRALPPRRGALLHFDYHPLNVMTDGRRVTAVLDWANAAAGDPRADLARTVSILRLAPLLPGARRGAALVCRLLEQGWRAGYRALTGTVRGMAPFYAWAGAMTVRDLAPKVARPDSWLADKDLDAMRRWSAEWKRRAGI
ncbi:MAG TPA: aminoglycoside phosphotransferase family protein [Thermomicrobiales bacterium]|nr:aminoglycoside phosphotransferase family protein [Thermomicrobiales bacterium]